MLNHCALLQINDELLHCLYLLEILLKELRWQNGHGGCQRETGIPSHSKFLMHADHRGTRNSVMRDLYSCRWLVHSLVVANCGL